MAILTTGNTFADGDQVTSTKLNNIANAATFASGAVDDSTTQLSSGEIIVKDLGISTGKIAASAVTTAKLATDSVSTAKIIDSNVTKAKIEDFTNLTVLGNVSGSAATPAEVTIIDDDTMGTASATTLATSESVKAYVDTQIGANNELSEVLANGNTTGANDIIVTAGQAITTDTVSETTAAAGVTVDSLLIKDGGITAAGTSTFAGQTISDLGTVTTANIDGGSIDGTTIGAASAAAITGTTITGTSFVGPLTGNVTGNVTGNLTGDVTGDVTGNVTGNVTGSLTGNVTGNISGNVTGGTGSFTTLTASDDVNFDSGTFFVDASANRVGIGTTSPGAELHIVSSGSSELKIEGGASQDNNIIFAENGTEQLYLGWDSSDASLQVKDPTDGFARRFVIQQSGNVGIGTSSPANTNGGLDASGAVLARGGVVSNQTSAGGLDFSGGEHLRIRSWGATSGTGYMSFRTGGGGGSVDAEAMRIDSSGNVGIGETSPTEGRLVVTQSADTSSGGIALYDSGNGSTFRIWRDGAGADSVVHFDDRGTTNIALKNGNVGIGHSSPNAEFSIKGDTEFLDGDTGTRIGLLYDNGAEGIFELRDNNVTKDNLRSAGNSYFNGGNVGIGTTSPSEKLEVSGNVSISGSISKGSGSFKIPHPLGSKKDTHNLVHSFLEGPQADLLYRGRVDLVDGVASVNIDTASDMTDGTFVLLCRDVQSFTTNESGWTAVRSSVDGNILTVEAQDNTCTDSISWMVVGERQDEHMYDTGWTDENGKVIVEPLIPEPEPEIEALEARVQTLEG